MYVRWGIRYEKYKQEAVYTDADSEFCGDCGTVVMYDHDIL